MLFHLDSWTVAMEVGTR